MNSTEQTATADRFAEAVRYYAEQAGDVSSATVAEIIATADLSDCIDETCVAHERVAGRSQQL